jgi:hypothetical protein
MWTFNIQMRNMKFQIQQFHDLLEIVCPEVGEEQCYSVVFVEKDGYSIIELGNRNGDGSLRNKISLFPNELLKALKIMNKREQAFEEAVLNDNKESHTDELYRFIM